MIPYIRAPFRPFRLRLHKREGVARLPPLAFVYASGRRIGQVLLRLVVLTLGLGRLFTFGSGGRGGIFGGGVFLCRFGVHVGVVHVVLCRFSGAVRRGAPG